MNPWEVKGKCQVPMWMGGMPAGWCGRPAFGVYIEGPTFRDGWTGEVRRIDGRWKGYSGGLCCPNHSGPNEFGPRVFQDGWTEEGRPMWCAVFHDFINLQESPAEFDERPWLAIQRLTAARPHSRLPQGKDGGAR
jgi:hypothetical protein